jgi:hypothetical protein
MRTGVNLSEKDGIVSVQIPLRLRHQGGRKLMIAPDGGVTAWAPPRSRVDSAMAKAIARAHRWRRMLESNEHTSIADLAAAEKINQSYVSRILRLTLLAPEIIEAILDGRQSRLLQLGRLLRPLPMEWERQRRELCL